MSKIFSNWFKVDLHIHTDCSNVTKTNDYDGEFNLSTLKEKLVENEVKLFSLTDHNIINAECYKEYYQSWNEGDPVLIIGCEFDIEVLQDDGSLRTYHTLLIFDDSSIAMVDELSGLIEKHFTDKGINPVDRKLTVDEIFQLFGKYHFFYIPHAGGHKNIIDGYKKANITKAQEMVLLMESAHEKVKEKHREKHRQGFDKLKNPDFRNRKDEAFINFSDNHDCSVYPKPKSGAEHEFYCLKGEPSFETLRFAFIDPESRIKKQSDVDRITNVKKHITAIDIKGVENITDNLIQLSPNMNVIIGGASSGKSLLFNMIGEKIQASKRDFTKYGKNSENVKIKASNSNTFQPNLPFNVDEVVYINQGDIVRFFEKGDLRKLVNDSGKDEEFTQLKTKLNNQKRDYIEELELFKNQFDRFNSSWKKDFILREDDISNMLSDKFHFIQVDQTISEYDFEDKYELLQDITENVEEFKNENFFDINAEELTLIEKFEELIINKNRLLQHKEKIFDAKINFLEKVSTIVNNKNDELESSSRAKSEAFKRKSVLVVSCSNIFSEANTFNEHSKCLEDYNYSNQEKLELNESVVLVLEVEKKKESRNYIINCLNQGNTDETIYQNFLKLVKDNDGLKDYGTYTESRLLQKLKKESEEILNQFEDLNNYLDYGDNGNSKNKSPGYNAEMYLKTILEQDTCNLVMIDQPEDNLGNTFKNEDLINLLRDYKFKKQIILVTHNPSIVVYGDAESIILAQNTQGQISYQQLVLENKDYQKQIIDNLDGGKVIFDMRSRKYNIKKLLNS
ncbi:uncharacterized protein HME9304_01831 [Flagellimonas maritima]|uniref:Polymerase/histidinol phosphatase N-terminal domain-containing protein n=1 Tax=Flagellimonas maritima TaxID=1383885 RepID=A0A2Z4LSM6_9FLAO|nr:PHP domain-containing protein [Allomuricauda aurantiaca]AWX44826.1 uncharacterized protein HME9304_01831 [Allomuricauda aurantiaca]